MLEVKPNGTIAVSKERKLTRKQLAILKTMPESVRATYLLSLLGLHTRGLDISRIQKHGRDNLKLKDTGSVVRKLGMLLNARNEHAPHNVGHGRWVGVEIECFIPHNCDEERSTSEIYELVRAKLKAAKVSMCTVKSDGSLSDSDGTSMEVTMVYDTKHGHEKLQRLCSVLRELGAYVNSTCGLHVHLDSRHLTAREATRAGMSIGHCLPVLSQMVPPSRRTNSYCRMGVSALNGERYYAVNLTAYEKFKTIEVRLHSGSVNFTKISNWIDTLKLCAVAGLTKPVSDFQEFIDGIGMPDRLIEYCEERLRTHSQTIDPTVSALASNFTRSDRSAVRQLVDSNLLTLNGNRYEFTSMANASYRERYAAMVERANANALINSQSNTTEVA